MDRQQHQFRAAIYARISQDRSGAQSGVTRQLEDTRKLAADLGWEVVEEFGWTCRSEGPQLRRHRF